MQREEGSVPSIMCDNRAQSGCGEESAFLLHLIGGLLSAFLPPALLPPLSEKTLPSDAVEHVTPPVTES